MLVHDIAAVCLRLLDGCEQAKGRTFNMGGPDRQVAPAAPGRTSGLYFITLTYVERGRSLASHPVRGTCQPTANDYAARALQAVSS